VGGKKIGGAVDKDVEMAEMLGGLLEEALDFGDAAKVGLEGDAFSSEVFDFGSGGVPFGLRTVVMDYDVGAFRGQAHGYGAADALCGAGDQCYATLQWSVHVERKGSTGQPEMAVPLGSARISAPWRSIDEARFAGDCGASG
jgi:hypothetical protein